MAAPTEAQIDKARWLAHKIVALAPNQFRRIWLTDWRGWRLIYETRVVEQCDMNCATCPIGQLLKRGLSDSEEPIIKTELHPWVTAKDNRLYGPIPMLACKSTSQFARGFISCMQLDPEYRYIDKLVEELELVRDSRLVWSDNKHERAEVVERRLVQAIVNTCFQVLDDAQLSRFREALQRLGWNGSNFA